MSNYQHYTVGVLALQGAVTEHLAQIEKLGAKGVAIKKVSQLEQLDALILPGGESTAIGKLMREYGFIEPLQAFAQHKPIFGTCAGMILLAKQIKGNEQPHLGLMDFRVQRNAFGRQIASFQTELTVQGLDNPFPAIFIRAPYVNALLSSQIEVLAQVEQHPVLVKQGKLLACSFHPELSDDLSIMKLFLDLVE